MTGHCNDNIIPRYKHSETNLWKYNTSVVTSVWSVQLSYIPSSIRNKDTFGVPLWHTGSAASWEHLDKGLIPGQTQWFKDPALPKLQLGWRLKLGYDPWAQELHMMWGSQKRKQTKNRWLGGTNELKKKEKGRREERKVLADFLAYCMLWLWKNIC